MKLLSPIETQLLALVANEELSGREVAQIYKEKTGAAISYGTLYTTFRRLKEQGWVKTREDHDEDGRVRFFKIDVDGRRALAKSRESHAELATFGLHQEKPA